MSRRRYIDLFCMNIIQGCTDSHYSGTAKQPHPTETSRQSAPPLQPEHHHNHTTTAFSFSLSFYLSLSRSLTHSHTHTPFTPRYSISPLRHQPSAAIISNSLPSLLCLFSRAHISLRLLLFHLPPPSPPARSDILSRETDV